MNLSLKRAVCWWCGLLLLAAALPAFANIPGGGTNGPNVTLTDNGSTVTIANGTVSIVCEKSSANIINIFYTHNNSGTPVTTDLVAGNPNGGKLYWELGGFGSGTFAYTLVTDPAGNNGNYAEISLMSTSASSGAMEVRFSLGRGWSGFYVTAVWYHGAADAALTMGETRDNIYAGSIFNWMSVDATRNRLMEVDPNGAAIGVLGAPVEVSLWTNGIYAGQYEDKYKYSADFGDQRVWGWSSVGAGGLNVGLWNVSASMEYYGGGPMKRELMEHIGTTILNMTRGSHYGGGTDSSWGAGEIWTHAYGPYFIYCNNITNSITATNQAAQMLYADAQAQAAAEATAWPYSWFTNLTAYATAQNRGTVNGQMLINDPYNPNASASNLWVGLVQQPITTTATYDFQKWMKPYQFWVRAGTNGTFSIPNVIAGANYTLYAFGPGAAGTFQSQAQAGGSAPNTLDIPASQFSVNVTGGATNNLGAVTWTPTRVGPTVFEIGSPDRDSTEFRHGEDWWVGDIGPGAANPLPIWSKFLEYPYDFPTGPSYTVGQSRWTTDWNFVQPVAVNTAGTANTTTSTINFNLASNPGATASLYIALSSDDSGPLVVVVNGTTVANYTPAYHTSTDESDSTVREGVHGMYTDNRVTFSGGDLKQGANTITITMNSGGNLANHAMYDYLRLELTGYVPPPPASVTAYSGNNSTLVTWPLTPGATGYNILRSTTSGSGYLPVTNDIPGPVCGSGWNNGTFVDTVPNGATSYYYVIQSVNAGGTSANSPQSSAVTASSSLSAGAPAAPAGLTVGNIAHQSVKLNWSPSSGANFYTVYRSTLVNNGGGASNVLNTIVLANNITGTSYTDTSLTDGSIYSYSVTATSAGGTSPNSAAAVAVPLPSPPVSAPGSLTGSFVQTTNVVLHWSPVTGAVGYIIRRATSPGGPFILLMSVVETNYTDAGLDVSLAYYYQVAAVNAAGVSPNASIVMTSPPLAPVSLSAVPGDSQITLQWTTVPNAAAYYLYRGLSSGNETTLVAGNYAGTSYTNTGLANGTTYYYVVAATNAVGLGPNSPEASATPGVVVFGQRNLTWRGDGSANLWNISGAANWQTNGVATVFNNGDSVTFDNTGSNNVPVSVAGNLQPALVTFNASKNFTFSGTGSITGTNALLVNGPGNLIINNTNTYSGGTVINGGALLPGSPGANFAGLGSGSITILSGTLQFTGFTGNNSTDYLGNTNPVIVPTGDSAWIIVPQRFLTPGLGGTLSGGGSVNLVVSYVRGDISGNWSGFTGNIDVIATGSGSTVDDFRVANSAGFPAAQVHISTNILMYSRTTAGAVIPIGEFSGDPGATVSAGAGSSLGTQNAVTWRVGGLNTSTANAASFQGTTALIKEGTGSWTLTGASTHTGSTVVNNGTLLINGSFNGSPVTVNGGALGGTGVIAGAPVTVNAGGAFAPGPGIGLGTLTINNNLNLAAGSTTSMQVQHSPLANSSALVYGALTEGGSLVVTSTGSGTLTNGDTFQLFNAGSYAGAFAGYTLPPLTGGLVWNTNTVPIAGTLSVVKLTSPILAAPGLAAGNSNLVLSGSGGADSWPYNLLSSTNLTLPTAQWTRIATGQFDRNGNFILTNPVTAGSPQMFYRVQVQ